MSENIFASNCNDFFSLREAEVSVNIRFDGRRFLTSVVILAGLLMQGIPGVAAANILTPTPHQVESVITSMNPHLSYAVKHRYSLQTLAAAKQAQIDPCLLIAIVSVESHWQASAISPHGAIGLGQLKPLTAASLHANPYSPGENLRATSQYLRLLLDQFAGPSENVTAIAAYNAGPGALARNHNIPPNASNRMYVHRVLGVWAQTRNLIAQSAQFQQPEQDLQTTQLEQPAQVEERGSWNHLLFFGHRHRAEKAPAAPNRGFGNQDSSDIN